MFISKVGVWDMDVSPIARTLPQSSITCVEGTVVGRINNLSGHHRQGEQDIQFQQPYVISFLNMQRMGQDISSPRDFV